jgi:hypothetical protein
MQKRKESQLQFATCIADSEPDLKCRKVYQVLSDDPAARSDYLRIVDESGEDYLYPASYFVFIRVSKQAEIVLRRILRRVAFLCS